MLFPCKTKTNTIYLSADMATIVKTEPHTDMIAMNPLTLQYMLPKGQCPFNMQTKLKVTFNDETMVSAILKLTEKKKIGVKTLLL